MNNIVLNSTQLTSGFDNYKCSIPNYIYIDNSCSAIIYNYYRTYINILRFKFTQNHFTYRSSGDTTLCNLINYYKNEYFVIPTALHDLAKPL